MSLSRATASDDCALWLNNRAAALLLDYSSLSHRAAALSVDGCATSLLSCGLRKRPSDFIQVPAVRQVGDASGVLQCRRLSVGRKIGRQVSKSVGLGGSEIRSEPLDDLVHVERTTIPAKILGVGKKVFSVVSQLSLKVLRVIGPHV